MTNRISVCLSSTAIILVCFCLPFASCRRQTDDQPVGTAGSRAGVEQKAGEIPSSLAQPDIQFAAESHDFGTIFQMQSYECVFTFRNAGTGQLKVHGVTRSCGCTATLLSVEELAPQEKGELKVELKPGMARGKVVRHVTLRSNDPDEPAKELEMKADVVPRLDITPRSHYFKQVRKREGGTKWFDVKPTELEEIRSVEMKCTTDHFSTELQPGDEGKNEYKVKVSIADDAPLGRISGALEFFVNGETEMCSRVPVTAFLTGDIDISPKRVLFRAKRRNQEILETVDITSGTGEAFRIRKVSSDIPTLNTELVSQEEGKHYSVTASLKRGTPAGTVRGNITIHTDNELQPEIKVPVYGTVN
jgi:hypothetical protein